MANQHTPKPADLPHFQVFADQHGYTLRDNRQLIDIPFTRFVTARIAIELLTDYPNMANEYCSSPSRRNAYNIASDAEPVYEAN